MRKLNMTWKEAEVIANWLDEIITHICKEKESGTIQAVIDKKFFAYISWGKRGIRIVLQSS